MCVLRKSSKSGCCGRGGSNGDVERQKRWQPALGRMIPVAVYCETLEVQANMNVNILRQLCKKFGAAGRIASVFGILPCLLFAVRRGPDDAELAGAPRDVFEASRLERHLESERFARAARCRGRQIVCAGVRDHPPYTAGVGGQVSSGLGPGRAPGRCQLSEPVGGSHTVFCAAGMPHIISCPWTTSSSSLRR